MSFINSETILGPEKTWDQELRGLAYGIDDALHTHYKCYWIRQGKKGKKRRIEEPLGRLLEIQKKYIRIFEQYPLHNAAYAVKGRSIGDNARVHENAKHVLRIDISKCYQSINMRHVWNGFDLPIALDLKIIFKQALWPCMLWDIDGDRSYLPTGAPTSPILCNIALKPIDIEVQALADHYGYKYTRYIDDLHLSTDAEHRDWELIDKIKDILKKHNLKPNIKKCRWQTNNDNDNLIITGVRVGQKSKVPREYARMVRARLNNLARSQMQIDIETRGCLAYISSIDQAKHDSLLKYYNRRLNHVPHNGQRLSPEQSIPSSSGHNS